MQKQVYLFRFIFPGLLTVVIILIFAKYFSSFEINKLFVVDKNQKSFFQIINLTLIVFAVGFVEASLLFPLFDIIYKFISDNVRWIPQSKKEANPHKKYIHDTIIHCERYFRSCGIEIPTEIKIDKNSIFDSYLNKYASDNELKRLFFLSDRRHMYINCYKIMIVSSILSVCLIIYYLIKNTPDCFIATALLAIFIIFSRFFNRLAHDVLKHLRPYEMALLTGTEPSLTLYIAKILKELMLNYHISLINEEKQPVENEPQLKLIESLDCQNIKCVKELL